MRILHIQFAGPYSEGWSYQENILPRYQVQLGHEVYMLTTCYARSEGALQAVAPEKKRLDDGVMLQRMPFAPPLPEPLRRKLRPVRGVYETLEELQPDFIFLHDVQSLAVGAICRYLRDHRQVKLVVDGHTDFSNSARNWLSRRVLHEILWRRMAQKLVPYAGRFYGTLPARADFFTEVYGIPREKVDFLPMGLDDDLAEANCTPRTRAEVRRRFDVGEGEFLVVTGGKIDPAKRQVLALMEAVRRLDRPRVKLLVFGSVAEELQEDFRALTGENVRYAGWATAAQSLQYFHAADLVVFPGRHSVYWEQAAGLGKPMVVKYWKGTTHVDTGGNVKYLYEDSAQEMASVLAEILDKPEQYETMTRAAERGKSCFSYREIAGRCITQ